MKIFKTCDSMLKNISFASVCFFSFNSCFASDGGDSRFDCVKNVVRESIFARMDLYWPIYKNEFNQKDGRTIFIPMNPLVLDAYVYSLIFFENYFLIQRSGGFSGGMTIFGPFKEKDFCPGL